MWPSLIIKNMKHFIRNKAFLFLFIMISQIVCVLASLTVAGMIDAVSAPPKNDEESASNYYSRFFYVNFFSESWTSDESDAMIALFDLDKNEFVYVGNDRNEARKIQSENNNIVAGEHTLISSFDELGTIKEIKPKLDKVLNAAGKYVRYYEILGFTDETQTVAFYASDGIPIYYTQEFEKINGQMNKISVVRNPYYSSDFQKIQEGDKITLGKTSYEVIQAVDRKESIPTDIVTNLFMTVSSLDESFKISSIGILLDESADLQTKVDLSEAIDKVFGSMVKRKDVPEAKPLEEKQFNNMIYVVCSVMIAVVILNIARLYSYIMSARKRSLAVFSMCGASKDKILLIYIVEIFCNMLVSFLAACAIFKWGLVDVISTLYPTFTDFFTWKIYLAMFGIYMGIGLVIQILNLIPIVNKSINDLTKGGK